MKQKLAAFFTNHWDAVLASIAGSLFIYYFTRHSGIGISPDSVMYQSTAENIRNHFSFRDFNNMPLVDFPLGYPSLLALASFLSGSAVLAVAPVLNALLFSAVIIMTSVIIQGMRFSSRWYKLALLSVIACSPALLEVYSMLWSETLFIFWILLFLIVARAYLAGHRSGQLWALALIASIAMVTRYAGISLLITGIAAILFDGQLARRRKIKHLLLFIGVGSFLFACNLIRNHFIAGSLTGVRETATRSLGDNIAGMAGTVASWFPFLQDHLVPALIVLGIVCCLAAYAFVFRLLQQQYFSGYETLVSCFLLVYISFMLFIASVSRFEELSSRLLAPMYIPLLITASCWLVPVIRRAFSPWRQLWIVFAVALLAAFHGHHYRLNAEAWEGIKDAGMPGYSEDSWTQSTTIAYTRQNNTSFTGPVYANANDAVYFLTGVHALPLPHKEIGREINELLGQQRFFLIWLNDGENNDLIGLDFIRRHCNVTLVQTLDDGAVYLCMPAHQ
ncbi:MAG: hypothetical protein JO301_09635 [Chitinophagaceae bacterium]|nr:hypothetical protein [Chitinophagaceae bacterium]